MQSVGNIKEIFSEKKEETLTKDQIVRKKLENFGVTGEQLFSESFKLSTAALVEERLKEHIFESPVEIAEVSFNEVGDITPYDNRSLRVKLLFVDIGETNRVVHTIMKLTGLVPKFGRIHTALAVGSKIVEWNDSSICYPRDTSSSKAILAVDIATLEAGKIDVAIKKLAEVIVKWNTEKEYGLLNANCQIFVDDCLKAIGVEPNFQGLFGDYVQQIRKTGTCNVEFRLSDELQDEFGPDFMKELGVDDRGSITFSKHEQLDRFTWKLLDRFGETLGQRIGEKDNIQPNHKELYALLKAFDRGYWLRYRKGDMSQAELMDGHRKCPFVDPVMTQTAWTGSSRVAKFDTSGQVSGNSHAQQPQKAPTQQKSCLLQ